MRGAVALCLLLLLAGCKGVGDGSGPIGVTITYNGSDDDLQILECSAPQLTAILHMEGGNDGAVTSLVKWSSSNPGLIDVSNGDIETEPGSGSYFAAGTVIARGAGNAVIRADYVGLSAAFSVTADPIRNLRITPELTYLAPGSVQTFKLEADLYQDEPSSDVTSSATWRLPSSSAPVNFVGTSTLQAASNPLGRTFTLEAQLFTCDRRAQQVMQLAEVTSLRLTHEQPEGLRVPSGYSDELKVEAVFSDASIPAQNVSGQVSVKQVLGASDEASLTAGSEALRLDGLKLNYPVQYRLRYEPLSLEVLTRVVEFGDIKLQSLRVTPELSTLLYPQTARLEAYGSFADGYERPVRRDITWTSLNTNLLNVVGTGTDAGELTPLRQKGKASIEASATNSAGKVKAIADVVIEVP